MIIESISKNSVLLGGFALVTTAASVITFQLTQDRIEHNQQAALEQRLSDVMPAEHYNNALLDDVVYFDFSNASSHHERVDREESGKKSGKENEKLTPIYLAFNKSQTEIEPTGFIIPTVAPDGYGGPIQMIVGVLNNGTISGVRIIPPHLETPGLGDAIDIKKSDWVLSFNGLSLDNTPMDQWAVKKEGGRFDQFTGATITPRAVINAVKNTLATWEAHRDAILLQHSIQQLNDSTPNDSTPNDSTAIDSTTMDSTATDSAERSTGEQQ